MKRSIYLVLALLMCLMTSCGRSADYLNESQAYAAVDKHNSELKVHYIDVGQGDSTLIENNGHYMLIDAGDNDKGTFLQLYLQKQGVTELDYLILTHPDADHIGGADVIITKFRIGTILMPDVENDTKTYLDVVSAMEYKGYKHTLPVVGSEYILDDARFTVTAPNRYDYGDNTNNYSIGLVLEHGSRRFLFVGDAQEDAKRDMLNNGIDLSVDVYKVAHHGSYTSAFEPFLQAVNPTYAVISSGEGNEYGHPHVSVLEWLREHGTKVYRTDEQGTVICTSDGENLVWDALPSETWEPGVEVAEEETVQESVSQDMVTYILNKNSKKFHYPGCDSVGAMKEKNKELSEKTREELIEEGYVPCGACKP